MKKKGMQRIAALALAAVLTITSFTSVPALEAKAAEPDAAGTNTEIVDESATVTESTVTNTTDDPVVVSDNAAVANGTEAVADPSVDPADEVTEEAQPEEEETGDDSASYTVIVDEKVAEQGYKIQMGTQWLSANSANNLPTGSSTQTDTSGYFCVSHAGDTWMRPETVKVKINGGDVVELTADTANYPYSTENFSDGSPYQKRAFKYATDGVTVQTLEIVSVVRTIHVSQLHTGDDYIEIYGSLSVPSDEDYTFTVSCVENYEVAYVQYYISRTIYRLTPDENGVYTVPYTVFNDNFGPGNSLVVAAGSQPKLVSLKVKKQLEGVNVYYGSSSDLTQDTKLTADMTDEQIAALGLRYSNNCHFYVENTSPDTQSITVSATSGGNTVTRIDECSEDYDGTRVINEYDIPYVEGDVVLTLTKTTPVVYLDFDYFCDDVAVTDADDDPAVVASDSAYRFSYASQKPCVTKNKDLTVYIKAKYGYKLTSVVAYQNYGGEDQKAVAFKKGSATSPKDGAFTIAAKNVTSGLTYVIKTESTGIPVSINAEHMTLTPVASDTAPVTVSEDGKTWNVKPGANFSFTVTEDEGYGLTDLYVGLADGSGEDDLYSYNSTSGTYTVDAGDVTAPLQITAYCGRTVAIHTENYVNVSAARGSSLVELEDTDPNLKTRSGNSISYLNLKNDSQENYTFYFSLTDEVEMPGGMTAYTLNKVAVYGKTVGSDTYTKIGTLDSNGKITIKYANLSKLSEIKVTATPVTGLIWCHVTQDGEEYISNAKTINVTAAEYEDAWFLAMQNGFITTVPELTKADSHVTEDEDEGYDVLHFTAADAGKTIKISAKEGKKTVTFSFVVAKQATKLQFTGLTKSDGSNVQQIYTKATYGLKVTPTNADTSAWTLTAKTVLAGATEETQTNIPINADGTFTVSMGENPIELTAKCGSLEITESILPTTEFVDGSAAVVSFGRATTSTAVMNVSLPKDLVSIYNNLDGSVLYYRYVISRVDPSLPAGWTVAIENLDTTTDDDGCALFLDTKVTGTSQSITIDTSKFTDPVDGAADYAIRVWIVQNTTENDEAGEHLVIANLDGMDYTDLLYFSTKDTGLDSELKITQKTKKIYQGQSDVLLATASYSKETTEYGLDCEEMKYPNNSNMGLEIACDEAGDGNIYLSTNSDCTPGTYRYLFYNGNDADSDAYDNTQYVEFTVLENINFDADNGNSSLSLDKSLVYKAEGKTATATAKVTYGSSVATKKVTYSLDQASLDRGITISNSGKITVPKDYVVIDSDYDTVTVTATAADCAENTSSATAELKIVGSPSTIQHVYVYGNNGMKELVEGRTYSYDDFIAGMIMANDSMGTEYSFGNGCRYSLSAKNLTLMTVELDGEAAMEVSGAKAGKCSLTLTANDGSKNKYTVNFYLEKSTKPALLTVMNCVYDSIEETLINNSDRTKVENTYGAGTSLILQLTCADGNIPDATISVSGAQTILNGGTVLVVEPTAHVTKITIKDKVSGTTVYTITNTYLFTSSQKVTVTAQTPVYADMKNVKSYDACLCTYKVTGLPKVEDDQTIYVYYYAAGTDANSQKFIDGTRAYTYGKSVREEVNSWFPRTTDDDASYELAYPNGRYLYYVPVVDTNEDGIPDTFKLPYYALANGEDCSLTAGTVKFTADFLMTEDTSYATSTSKLTYYGNWDKVCSPVTVSQKVSKAGKTTLKVGTSYKVKGTDTKIPVSITATGASYYEADIYSLVTKGKANHFCDYFTLEPDEDTGSYYLQLNTAKAATLADVPVADRTCILEVFYVNSGTYDFDFSDYKITITVK